MLWSRFARPSAIGTADELRKPNVTLGNILFAMDFSPDSLRAFPFAAGIALHYGGKVFVTHIVPTQGGDAAPLEEQASLDTLLEASMEAGLNDPLASLRDVPHEVLVDHGDICARVLAAADTCKIDLVVIGTHGWHGIKRLVKGSTAEEITCLASRPVLTVGPNVSRRIDFKSILYPTDFKPPSVGALRYAASLAQAYGADLIILHVNEGDGREAPADAAPKTSEFLREHLTGYGTNLPPEKVKVIVDFGSRTERILERAARSQVDLIVMGVNHLGSMKARIASHLPISASYEVVSRARCPVLTVPSTQTDA